MISKANRGKKRPLLELAWSKLWVFLVTEIAWSKLWEFVVQELAWSKPWECLVPELAWSKLWELLLPELALRASAAGSLVGFSSCSRP